MNAEGCKLTDNLDTSAARGEILARIRTLQGRPASYKPREEERALEYVAQHSRGPQPSSPANVVDLFVERSKAMLTTVAEVKLTSEASAEAARYLQTNKLDGNISVWPALSGLDWSALGEVRFGEARGEDMIGISAVAGAVAETGTLVFASRDDQPSSTHLLPETHIAIVKASQVVHTMEDAFDALRKAGRCMPRALNFVSGPSRTADIEQTIVLGAHGPYRVHVILVTDE